MSESPARQKAHLQAIARQAMLDRQLEPDFPPAALAELGRIAGPAHPEGPAGGTSVAPIRDLRELPWCSIDNDDSRDLDQLTVAESDAKADGRGGAGQGGTAPAGTVKVLVAVADVDAVVAKGSALDGHAGHNTTSVYTAAEIFPMLPERLSTDLTSLREGQERLAIVIEMVNNSDGVVVASDLYRATVVNHGKLAYNAVAAWLVGQGPMPPRVAAVPGLADQLRLQDRVAQALRAQRFHHGALTLQTIESQAVFDGDALIDLQPVQQNRAEALIEDLMIAANGVTARYLESRGVPAFRRVLHVPERWDRIVELAAGVGEHLPGVPDAAALDAFLARRQ